MGKDPSWIFCSFAGIFFFFFDYSFIASDNAPNSFSPVLNLFHTALWGGDHFEPHFTDEKGENVSNFPKDTR